MESNLLFKNGTAETNAFQVTEAPDFENIPLSTVSMDTNVIRSRIKIISQNDDFDALKYDWEELASATNTHIFQTFEWNRTWWKHFGAGHDLHILTIYTGDKLVGLAPFFVDDVKLLGYKVYSCLRLLGSNVSQPPDGPLLGRNSYSDYLDFLINPDYEHSCYQLFLQYFNENKSNFNEIILDEIPENSTLLKAFIPLLSTYGLKSKIRPASTSPIIELNPTWEEYLKSLNLKERYHARRYINRSQKGRASIFNIKSIRQSEELPGVLRDLIQMHQQQWNDRGFAGTFAEMKMLNFFMEIAKSLHEKNRMQICMAIPMDENANCVAIDVLLTYKNKVCLMHRGLETDSSYRKKGPGNVLLYSHLNEAIQKGFDTFDLLRGQEDFKLRMATKINRNNKILLYSGIFPGGMLSSLIKFYLMLLKHTKLEMIHFKVLISGKSLMMGMQDYVLFMSRRIQHKFHVFKYF